MVYHGIKYTGKCIMKLNMMQNDHFRMVQFGEYRIMHYGIKYGEVKEH